MTERDVLLDVSRLIWRLWRGRLPTGVDRVCLAYLEHFRGRSRAVVQRKGHHFILAESHSDELFDLLSSGPKGFRRGFIKLALRAFASARRAPERKNLLYLNVGHTGLDEPSLVKWTKESSVRAIFLIHDLIPLLHPEYCRPGERAKHERRIENVLRSATGIIANSEATLRDIRAFANAQGMSMPQSLAAFIAGSAVPHEVSPRRFDRPHFVTVGTIEGRKNHALLLHLWRRMAAEGSDVPILVIIGQRGWEADEAIAMLDRSEDLDGHVIELSSCTDMQLAEIVTGAQALLMPSFAEGFGLPVAEALELGTPVIASDLPVFREFAGDIPTYLDPMDGVAWEQAIQAFSRNCGDRQRQLRAACGYRAPNWRSHFMQVDKWIETLSK